MFHYVVFVWNDAAPGAGAGAQVWMQRLNSVGEPWRTIVSEPGLEVRCAGQSRRRRMVRRLGGGWGVVRGELFAPFDFYDPLGAPGDAERLAPRVSQPLMGVCLRIPVDVLTAGGWDRVIAHRAFHDVLPPQIRNRRNKGGIEAHMRLTVQRNRPLLRELLLDGELVRAGLLVRDALKRALAGMPEIKTQSGELLEYACLEASLRCWRRQDSSGLANMWHTP